MLLLLLLYVVICYYHYIITIICYILHVVIYYYCEVQILERTFGTHSLETDGAERWGLETLMNLG